MARTGHYTPLPFGCSPLTRPLEAYLLYGILNLDKPVNPSSHEVVSWIKRIMNCEKTGHSGTLDPKVSGCLLVCLNRATRLVKAQQSAGKEYIAVVRFHSDPGSASKVQKAALAVHCVVVTEWHCLRECIGLSLVYNNMRDEKYLRRVVMPLELILTNYPRIVVKDSAVNAICYGAQLMIPGVLRFEQGIEVGSEIVMMTTKGEAIATGIAQMTTAVIASVDHGVVSVIKRVIMERDTYNMQGRWGYGPRSTDKKKLILAGKLTEKGKPNENTPKAWLLGQGRQHTTTCGRTPVDPWFDLVCGEAVILWLGVDCVSCLFRLFDVLLSRTKKFNDQSTTHPVDPYPFGVGDRCVSCRRVPSADRYVGFSTNVFIREVNQTYQTKLILKWQVGHPP
ncbi:H/ACA ribonucleoprotein complex subunit 4 (CBF5 homolog) (Dyskerin) (Nopp-140-associated protein of 57 kDa homolog) (AtNAP57) (Nucleolar protein NAP57 homolog) [Durusdinium trenchii]|uniref:H/ACA ribonucleoprotein complex subunit 4 (CBF5 homolog) (Dyskerin) (Nopp-140-associated protein of 57 kDa homolog) (AtNAP57) (Nucleolar protein NAP57 homolog) n=1 Tax=Durusdinium trenchii TaxID=1381693 RepID=A0ABP0M8S7_9DINO